MKDVAFEAWRYYLDDESYLILAGPRKDSDEEFKVYKWSASKKKADPLDHIDLKGMKPEGLMQIPGTKKMAPFK